MVLTRNGKYKVKTRFLIKGFTYKLSNYFKNIQGLLIQTVCYTNGQYKVYITKPTSYTKYIYII